MLKFLPLLFCVVLSSSLEAQDMFRKSRPWDPAWRAAYSNRVARLKSDSLNIFVRKGDMEATIENIKGEQRSLETLLSNLHGNIVVMTTWNKDCPGELESIIDMFPLMEEFAEQPVVFLFINTFNRKEDWKIYSSSGRINEVKYNFRLTNPRDCKLLRTFATSRSTATLLDRQGRLCNAYAPNPKDGLAGYIRNLLKDDQFDEEDVVTRKR